MSSIAEANSPFCSKRYSPRMGINRELHLKNLNLLVERYKGNKRLSDAITRGLEPDAKPIQPSQISQALRGSRPFAEKIHRKIEAALDLSPYWFEIEHDDDAASIVVNGSPLSGAAVWVARVFDRLPRAHQESIVLQLHPHLTVWAEDLISCAPHVESLKPGEAIRNGTVTTNKKREGDRTARAISKPFTRSD